ncbi:MAG: NAD(P)-dependent alcohol dehydrogenase [Ignavibacterium sp.]|nr:NAD(P)-dependent alcohol dehydrogenase [Ignavibacterium sp.]
MKAIIYTKYGPPNVLQLREVEKPQPKENEVLIKIIATAVNSGDWRLRKADPFMARFFTGLFKPKKNILGVVLSGVIEIAGRNITRFKEGDHVFALSDRFLGAYAEYICLPEVFSIALKPANVSYEEAAAIPFGGHTALYFLRKANIKSGQSVLVYGASGAVGTAAVQIAKYYGAIVAGVCSTANVEIVKGLGADNVIDYTKTNVADINDTFGIVFETVNKVPISNLIKLLKNNGTLILGSAMLKEMFQGSLFSLLGKIKVLMGEAKATADDMNFMKELVESGRLKPVIDRIYPLEKIAEAHAYVEKGHKRGNVVIKINEN